MALIIKQSNDFLAMDLMEKKEAFSYSGAMALIDYLNELSEDIGQDIEYDRVAIRCDYSEYTKDEMLSDYKHLLNKEDFESEEDFFEALLQELKDNTTVLEVDDNTYIIQSY